MEAAVTAGCMTMEIVMVDEGLAMEAAMTVDVMTMVAALTAYGSSVDS